MPDTKSGPDLRRVYARILRTYVSRPGFWVWTPVIVGASLFVSSRLVVDLILKGATPDVELLGQQLVISAFFLAVTCVHFSTCIAGHTARLLDLPHNHTVPNLRRPVLVVAFVLTLPCVALPPFVWPRPLLTPHGWSSVVGAGAVATLVAGEFAWIQCWPKLMNLGSLPVLVGVVPWIALVRGAVRGAFFNMLHGRNPTLAAALYLAAAVVWVTLGVRLVRRRQLVASGPLRLWPRRPRDAARRPERWFPRHAPATTLWRRVRLRTFLTAAGARDGIVGAAGGLIFSLGALSLQFLFGPGEPGISLILSLVISLVVPFLITVRMTEARPALLTFELMLPQSRRDVVRDVGLAMLMNLFAAWGAAQLAVLATFAVFAPADLRAFAGAFAVVLPVAAAYQLFFFGVLAWFLSFRPNWINGSAFSACSLIVVPLLARMFRGPEFATAMTAATAAVGLVLAGILLMLTALRRWSLVDVAL